MDQKYNLLICTHTMFCLSRSEDNILGEITKHSNNFTAGVQIKEISRGAVKNIVTNRLGLYTVQQLSLMCVLGTNFNNWC
jgi:hypothetical protein